MIKTAVIGAGYIGMVHLETLMRIPGIQVQAVAEANEGLRNTLAAKFNVPVVTADYRRILDDPEIVAVHNCTPNHVHFEINQAIAQAGKHIMSEKPLCVTSEESRVLNDLVAKKNLVNGINFCYRYYPTVQEAAARVRRGDIGAVQEIVGAYLQDWLLYETDYSWRLEKKYAGGSNTVADIGCHWFDLAQFVSGAKISEVMADLHTFVPVRKRPKGTVLTFAKDDKMEYDDIKIELEDYASILLHFDNGARGVTTVSELCAGRKCALDVQLYGSKSALSWSHEDPAVLWQGRRDEACGLFRENPIQQDPSTRRFARLPSGHPMGYFDAVLNLFNDFYTLVRAKQKNEKCDIQIPDFAVGHNQMQIIEAVLKSQKEGRWVKVG